MNGLPYYKAYPRDFIEGTIGMPFEIKCAYRVVLDLIYMQGGELPDDARYISGLLGCSIRKWNAIRSELVAIGKLVVSGEFLMNDRAIIELETLAKLQDKQRENGRQPKKIKRLAKPRLNQPEPEPYNPLPLERGGDEKDHFSEWWEAYPKRDGANPRKAAQQKYELAIRKGANPDELLRGVKAYAAELQKKGKAGTEFVMQAARFINQEIWRDYLDKPTTASAAKPGVATLDSISEDQWRKEVDRVVKHRGMCQWIFRHLTPPPNDPATRVPPHILAEFNLSRAA